MFSQFEKSFFIWNLIFTAMFSSSVEGLLNISSLSSWSSNGTTVAGQSSGAFGSGIRDLYYNRGISISSDDILYIADRGNDRIVFVPVNRIVNIQFFGTGTGSDSGSLNYPCDIHVTNTSVYVLDKGNSRIQNYSRNDLVVTTMLTADSVSPSFNMFIDQNENLYLSDYSNCVVIYIQSNSMTSQIVAGNGRVGSAANQLNKPNGLHVDDDRTIYVADTLNHRIQKWMFNSTVGVTVAGITALQGSNLLLLSYPESVVVDINGHMYIVDRGNNRIVRWAPNSIRGVCIASCTGRQGNQTNQLYYPIDLAFDSQGSLYVSDDGNSRVQRFEIVNNSNTTSPSTTTLTSLPISSQNTSRRDSMNTTPMATPVTNSLSTQENINSLSNSIKSTVIYLHLCLLMMFH